MKFVVARKARDMQFAGQQITPRFFSEGIAIGELRKLRA
jgi:hypothetical protein